MKLLAPLVAVFALAALALGGAAAGQYYLLGVVIPYVAFALFLFGFSYKIYGWAKTPVPFNIPTTCGQRQRTRSPLFDPWGLGSDGFRGVGF